MIKSVRTFLSKVLPLCIAASMLLTGCTPEEQRLLSAYDALIKQKSFESEYRVSFELDYSGGDGYFEMSMLSAKCILDNLELYFSTKHSGDGTGDKYIASVYMEGYVDPVRINAETWLDIDADKPKYHVITKIPALVKAFLPDEYKKDYLSVDYIEFLNEAAESMGINAGALLSAGNAVNIHKFEEKLGVILSKSEILSGLVKASVLGSDSLMFTVTDRQAKDIIISFFEAAKTDKEMRETLVDIFRLSAIFGGGSTYYGYYYYEIEELVDELLDEEIEEIKEYFEHNRLLGDKGISYEVKFDHNGCITDETFVIDIDISNSSYMPYPYGYGRSYSSGLPEISANLTITVNGRTSKIGQGVEIDFPELTEANSVDLTEAIKKQAEEQKERQKYYFPHSYYSYVSLQLIDEWPAEFRLTGSFEGSSIDETIMIMKHGYSFYMPLRQAAEIFGGEVRWHEEEGTADWVVDGMILIVMQNAYANYWDTHNYDHDSDNYERFKAANIVPWPADGYLHDGAMYIDMSEIEYFLGIDFGFDTDTDTIIFKEYR